MWLGAWFARHFACACVCSSFHIKYVSIWENKLILFGDNTQIYCLDVCLCVCVPSSKESVRRYCREKESECVCTRCAHIIKWRRDLQNTLFSSSLLLYLDWYRVAIRDSTIIFEYKMKTLASATIQTQIQSNEKKDTNRAMRWCKFTFNAHSRCECVCLRCAYMWNNRLACEKERRRQSVRTRERKRVLLHNLIHKTV